MHAALLHTHNLLRWVVLILGALAIVRIGLAVNGGKPYAAVRKFYVMFMASLHLQLLLGLLLFLFSPTVQAAMRDMAATMADRDQRFIVAEHPTLMVLAAVWVTIGGIIAKNRKDERARHIAAVASAAITYVLLLAGIPWQRALFPGM